MKNQMTAETLRVKLSTFKDGAKLYYTLPDEDTSTYNKMYIKRLYEGNHAEDATGLIFTEDYESAMTSIAIQERLKTSRQNMPVCLVIGQQEYDVSLLISGVFPDENGNLQLEFEVQK